LLGFSGEGGLMKRENGAWRIEDGKKETPNIQCDGFDKGIYKTIWRVIRVYKAI
jgi:hypothetical protein